MKKIFLGLTLLFLSGCYQTLKSSYPYESCLVHASGSIPFVNVQDCAQRAVSAWQSKDPNLRVERNLYLDAYVNDLVDQVRRGQVSDSRARLMFAQKVNELNAAAYRQKEYEEELKRLSQAASSPSSSVAELHQLINTNTYQEQNKSTATNNHC